jgi:hypothetical protein
LEASNGKWSFDRCGIRGGRDSREQKKKLEDRVKRLERLLGRKTEEIEILKEAYSNEMNPQAPYDRIP